MRVSGIGILLVVLAFAPPPTFAADELDNAEAVAALRRAVTFFRQQVAVRGCYLWRYQADLQAGEGEGRASRTTAWVQPPGTPTVGEAYLTAYFLTQDAHYLEAAVETATGLAAGQLQSGGWDYRIEFGEQRERYRYRVDTDRPQARNVTTLDDDVTQSALRFLMRVDAATEFRNEPIHRAVTFALEQLERAQYPNGAWPQRFSGPPQDDKFPVRPANYPDTWPREYPAVDYRSFYTFNDNTIADTIETFFLAAAIYKEPRYQAIGEKGGDFILLAQMPDPQPAWAQQYNAKMQPAWARRFEPAAVTGGESQGVMRTLLKLYEWTGKEKYLQPIPKALAYLRKSQLPDGRLARFYELKSNRPLYFTKDYKLTYEDDDLPTHYGFQVGSSLDSIERTYDRIRGTAPRPPQLQMPGPVKPSPALTRRAVAVVDAMDERGAWVEAGTMRTVDRGGNQVIEARTFAKNITTLAQFIAAQAKR